MSGSGSVCCAVHFEFVTCVYMCVCVKGPPRAPLDKLLDVIMPSSQPPPLVSVDIPR